MDSLGHITGLPGLMASGLTCGSLRYRNICTTTVPYVSMYFMRQHRRLSVVGECYQTLTSAFLVLKTYFNSSVSSALNAVPAIIVEDYIKLYYPNLSEVRLGYLSKVTSAVVGLISFSLIFVIASIGSIVPVIQLHYMNRNQK